MVNISTQDYEVVTTMEEISFPATYDRITISQNSIAGSNTQHEIAHTQI
jgi:hypothetical protein